MKRLLCLFISTMMILSCLTACSTKPEFEVLEIGGYDCFNEANHGSDITLGFDREVESGLSTNKNIVYDGVEYTLSYDSTYTDYLYNNARECYSKFWDGGYIKIDLNKENGRIDRYSLYDSNYLEKIILPELSCEECLSIARLYLGAYVYDAEQYELVKEKCTTSQQYQTLYEFEFARVIEGIQTSDKAYIDITVYGTVVSHFFSSLGEMRGAKLPTSEEMDAIEASVESKLAKIYAPVKDEYSVSYDLVEVIFMRLKDGSYALQYEYCAELTSNSDEQNTRHDTTMLLVRLN